MAVAKALDSSPPEQIAAVAGGQADGEVSQVIRLNELIVVVLHAQCRVLVMNLFPKTILTLFVVRR